MLESPKEFIGIISQLNNEIYDLHEKLNNEDADFLELEKQAHIDALKGEINNLKVSNENYQKEIQAMRKQMQGRLFPINAGDESIREENISDSLKNKIKQLEDQLERSKNEITKQKEELKNNKEFYVKEINRISEENKINLENLQTSSGDASQNEEYKKLLVDCQAMRNNNLEINSILQKEINERFNVSRKLNELQAKYEEEMMKVQSESAEYSSVFFSLTSMFNTSDSAEIVSKIHKLVTSNDKTCNDSNEIATLKENLQNEMLKNKKLNELINDKNIQDLELENMKLKERIEILLIQNKEANNSSFDEIQNKFKQDNQELKDMIKELTDTNNKMKEKIEILQNEKEQLNKENSKIRQDNKVLSDEKNKLQFEVEGLEKEKANNSSSFSVSPNQIQDTLFEISQYFANLEVQNSLTTAISVLLSSIGSGEEDYKEPLSNLENAAQSSNNIVLKLMIKTFDQIAEFQNTLQFIQEQTDMLAKQVDNLKEKQDSLYNKKTDKSSKGPKFPIKLKRKSKIPVLDNKYDITNSYSPRQSPSSLHKPKAKNPFVLK